MPSRSFFVLDEAAARVKIKRGTKTESEVAETHHPTGAAFPQERACQTTNQRCAPPGCRTIRLQSAEDSGGQRGAREYGGEKV
jgi:hypothetical protein